MPITKSPSKLHDKEDLLHSKGLARSSATSQGENNECQQNKDLHARIQENLRVMFATCYDPISFKAELSKCLKEDSPRFTKRSALKMLHIGWEATLAGEQSTVTNIGVVAALIFSVVVGLCGKELTPILEDDSWSDHRERIVDLHSIMVFLATLSTLTCVIFSVIWLTHSTVFVQDAADLFWFQANVPSKVCDTTLVIGLIATGISLLLQYVAEVADPKASLCFYFGVVVFSFVLCYYLWSLYGNSTRERASQKMVARFYSNVVEEVYSTLTTTFGLAATE